MNGDGHTDVIVGAPLHDAGGSAGADRGRAYLYLGSPSGLSASPAWTTSGDMDGARYGFSVAGAGDVNGDGFSDVVVGAYNHDAGGTARGRAYLYLGSLSGLQTTAPWTVSGDEDDAFFGYSVATAGDVNRDGFSDLVIGANTHDAGASLFANRGRAYVYLGSSSGPSTSPIWTGSGDSDAAAYGTSVGTAGDVNGDGFSDILIGAHLRDGAGFQRGQALVYLGTFSGVQSAPVWTAEGNEDFANLGTSVASAGDVNGDGYSDLLVSAPFHDAGAGFAADRGQAYLYLGSPTGLLTFSWVTSGPDDGAQYGRSVAGGRDVNGDGFSDALVGAPLATPGDWGYLYLYRGNGGPGLSLYPRQLRSDLSAPIAPLGLAHDQAFLIGLTLRSPAGRTHARIEWQRAQLGESFLPALNPVQTSTNWWGTSGGGVPQTTPASLPFTPSPYTWRARVRYHTATSPFLRHGPWVSTSDSGRRETKLRSTGQPAPPPCIAPDEAVFIESVTLNGQSMPVLSIQDPNQPSAVTGYNVYRATSPPGPFTLVASDIVDMDAGTPNTQWVDQNGAAGGPYYYQVRAYNHTCAAEGP